MNKEKQKSRKKQRIVFGVIGMICLGVGITLAVLVAETEKRANIFQAGEVEIDLTEEEWDKLDPKDKIVSPGKKVKKDPKVKNTKDSDLYAYIEVWVPAAEVRLIGSDGKPKERELTELFTYEINEPSGGSGGWIALPEYTRTEPGYEVYLYGYSEILKPGDVTVTLFDRVTYANMIEGDVPEGTNVTIQIYAYAIQAEYLGESGSTIEAKLKSAYEKYLAEEAD